MEDREIVMLFLSRSETAIEKTQDKYSSYLFAVADNILSSPEDSHEVVNDTYIALWDAIPPERPDSLKAYAARITRNLSIKRLRERSAGKRGKNEACAAIEEIDALADETTVPDELDRREIGRIINSFIASLRVDERRIFVCRYFYLDSIRDICNRFGYKESKVKMTLSRTKEKLKNALEKEGITV